MIQELLGGAGLLGGERKFSFHGVFEELTASSTPCASSNTNTTTTTTLIENLRCPRCDSPNTKFCYYNNYNLTQPRHFCKTCRRYWTKGGALRNVPIGGGCRKSKSTIVSSTTGKSPTGKFKDVANKSNLGSGFDYEQSTNPILWGSPQNSQLLALLRSNQSPNPNPNSSSMSNFVNFKDEEHSIGSHVLSEPTVLTGALNARTLGLDPLGEVPVGLYSPFLRNNQHQLQHQQLQQQNLLQADVQNTGIQEFYQRLRSTVNYYPDRSSAPPRNVTLMPTSSSSMMEPPPVAGGEFGSWNAPFGWSDLSTTSNGAFP